MSNNHSLNKINLNHLLVFMAIAETRNLTQAAKMLGSEKTRVSRVLSEFENDLNTELVYRTTRDMRLTEAGEQFYIRCKRILGELEDATNQLSCKDGEVSGHIRMTAAHGISSAILPQLLKEFNKLHPNVTFEILMTQQSLNLVKEGIDLALRVGVLEDSSYKVKKIGDAYFTFAGTPVFLSNHQHMHHLKDLASIPVLALPSFNNKILLFKNAEEEEVSIKLESSICCNSPDLLLDLTLKDLGLGLVPEFMCRDHFKTGQLIRVFENWNTRPVPVSLLFHASGRKATHVSAFIAFLTFHFTNSLQ